MDAKTSNSAASAHTRSVSAASAHTRSVHVDQFRFMSTSDTYMRKYRNWSRCYEYPEVMKCIPLDVKRIHNTACGIYPNKIYPWQISKMFADDLRLYYANAEIYNSDINVPPGFPCYDITKPIEHIDYQTFDCVLCISTIEHLKSNPIAALKNLINQCRPEGKIIVTMDYPRVNLAPFEDFLGVKCKDVFERLNGGNSKYPNEKYKHLNIVFLEMTKL